MTDYNDIARFTREKEFNNHKATVVLDNDMFLIMDWRNVNGSGIYFVRYILDKHCGVLFIRGDIGSAVFTWNNQLDAKDLACYVKDYQYFFSKLTCSTNKYTYKDEDIREDVKELQRDHYNGAYDEDDMTFEEFIRERPDEEIEFWENLADDISDCRWGPGYYTEELTDKLCEFLGLDWMDYPLAADAGQRIHPTIIMWAEGFAMAYKDAFENKGD